MNKEKEKVAQKEKERSLLERLAELEHEQWTTWAKEKTPDHPLINISYSDMTEEDKEKDRFFARKVIELLVRR